MIKLLFLTTTLEKTVGAEISTKNQKSFLIIAKSKLDNRKCQGVRGVLKPRPRKWPISKSVRMKCVFPASSLGYKYLVPGR